MPDARRPTTPPRPGARRGTPPPALPTARLLAGLFTLAAGLGWTVKATLVLAGEPQPLGVFEWATAAQGVALAALTCTPGWRLGLTARASAWWAALLGLGAGLAYGVMPEHWLFNVLFLLANLAVVFALFLVGRRIRRAALLGRGSGLPRGLALWIVPALLAGGLLAEIEERWLEVPILVFGLGWCLLGVVVLGRRSRPPEPEAKPVSAAKRPAGVR